jgi:photosystem II stability/assembly factor-like uncharacterized protein
MVRTFLLASLLCCCAGTILPQQMRFLSLPKDNYLDVSFSDSLNGWIAGSEALYRTTDGGNTWNRDPISNSGTHFSSICSPSSSSAWLARFDNQSYSSLDRTINGGSTWQNLQRFPFGSISKLTHEIIRSTDSLRAWVGMFASPIGGFTYVAHTTNGGQSWSMPLTAYDYNVNSFAALDLASDSVLGTIFSHRFLYTTSNAGATWRKDTLQGRYYALAMKRSDCIWLVGDSGKILKSNTGGAGYSLQASGTTAQLLSISALDTSNICVSGTQGTLLQSTNGGLSWGRIAVPVVANLNAVCLVNRNLAWIVGDSGVAIQYRNGLLTNAHILFADPQAFVLNHNYPNPFNPSTRISFSLNSEGFVELEAYDVTGRLVDILLRQKESAGDHVVDWAPNRLSSGIYFVILKVGSETHSEKVVLLR